MGEVFQLCLRFIYGHAVENCFAPSGPPAVGRTDVGASSHRSNALLPFRRQLQNRLQMARSFSRWRGGGSARPLVPDLLFAAATRRALGQSHPAVAPASAALGRQENLAAAPGDFSAPPGSLCPLHSSVLAAFGPGASAAAAGPQRAVAARAGIDTARALQPSVDGGFQGLVPHCRWPTAGTLDGARSVQSLWAVSAVAAQSGRRGRTPGFPAFVWPAGFAAHHPRGQWFALRGQRRFGVVAFVGLVAAVGHPRRVHTPGAPGRQRGPRTVSRLLPAGDRKPRQPTAARPARAFGSLVGQLQSRPAARSFAPAHARGSLSSESASLSPSAATLGLSQNVGSATRAQPGTYQMAGTTAVHRPGLCGPESRTEALGRQALGNIFGQTTHRPPSPQGPARFASPSLAAPLGLEGLT